MLCIVSVETTVYSHTHTHTHMFAQASLLEAENGTLTKRVAAEVKRRAEAENKATTLELQLENERQITADLKDQCESLRSQSTQVGRVATNVWLPPIFFPCDCLFLFPPFSSLAHIHYVSLSLTRIHAHTLSLSLSLSRSLPCIMSYSHARRANCASTPRVWGWIFFENQQAAAAALPQLQSSRSETRPSRCFLCPITFHSQTPRAVAAVAVEVASRGSTANRNSTIPTSSCSRRESSITCEMPAWLSRGLF